MINLSIAKQAISSDKTENEQVANYELLGVINDEGLTYMYQGQN